MIERQKKNLPPKARSYLDLVKKTYKSGHKPLSKAMKEASRLWRIQNRLK